MNYHYNKLRFSRYENREFEYRVQQHDVLALDIVKNNEDAKGKLIVRNCNATGHVFDFYNKYTFPSSYCNIYIVKWTAMENLMYAQITTEIERLSIISAKIYYGGENVLACQPIKTNYGIGSEEPGIGSMLFPSKNEIFNIEYNRIVELGGGETLGLLLVFGFHSMAGTPTEKIRWLCDIDMEASVRFER